MSQRRRSRSERGSSALELAMYMPILMLVIFIAVQFALVYLGNQAANAVARETARVARVTGNPHQARVAGQQYAANLSKGVLEDMSIAITVLAGDRVRVTVRGQAQKLAPVGVPTVEETIEGPLEEYKVDAP